MTGQYSDSSGPLLAIDSASPTASYAIGHGSRVLAVTSAPSGPSSPGALRLIHEVLERAGCDLRDLAGAIAVRGPGSFTGLRIGLSTLLGLHRSTGLPCTSITTFDALAWQARDRPRPIVAAVDALRSEWFTQTFEPGRPPAPREAPRLRTAVDLAELGDVAMVGFEVERLTEAVPSAERIAADPLAVSVLELAEATEPSWEPATLTEPLYLRPPAATPPRRRAPTARA